MKQKRDIKQEILINLLSAPDGLRYVDARPKRVENDLYNYHLQSLVRDGYVDKHDGLYRLSLRGQSYAAFVQPINPLGKKKVILKQNALCILYRDTEEGREVLNQTRKVHPFYGKKGILGGTVRPGERITEAASRKLIEECGLRAEFTYGASFRSVFTYEDDEVFQDIIFHICYADEYTGDLLTETTFGVNYWELMSRTIQNEENKMYSYMDPVIEFLELLKDDTHRSTALPFIEIFRKVKQ